MGLAILDLGRFGRSSPVRCSTLENSNFGFSKGKTAAEDGIFSEMLAALNDENLTTLAEVFRLKVPKSRD